MRSITETKQPFAIRVLVWFAGCASAAMFLSIVLAIYDIGTHIMGGERASRDEWLQLAAPLVAVIGILMAFIYGSAAQGKTARKQVSAPDTA